MSSSDIPEPPQCELPPGPLLDCNWAEQSEGSHADQCEPLCHNIPVEPAVEATEFTVSTIDSENHPVSLKREKSKREGSVAIDMSAQPLLELKPREGRSLLTVFIALYSVTWLAPSLDMGASAI